MRRWLAFVVVGACARPLVTHLGPADRAAAMASVRNATSYAQLEAAADQYLRTFAGGPDAPEIYFRLAGAAQDRDTARTWLRLLIERFPRSPYAEAARAAY